MFPYFGSKATIATLYPGPVHEEIIEPFAGSARYSLLHWQKKVTLIDRDPAIVEIWNYLKQANPGEITSLPRLTEGESLDDYGQLSGPEKYLLGLIIAKHSNRPRKMATSWATTHRPNHINFHLKRIARNLFKIKHWEIQLSSYELTPNRLATWFIDPPYKKGGEQYRFNVGKLDHGTLRQFCLSRLGQVIVCEGTGATWLPFRDLVTKRTTRSMITERVYTSNNGELIEFQPTLF